MDISWRVVEEDEHFEVYINDKFYCSVDTIEEGIDEVENYLELFGPERS